MSERYDLLTARKAGDKTYWTRVGVMFPNRDKPGFRLVFEALPVPQLYDGKLEVTVMAFPPKDSDERPAKQTGAASKPRGDLDDDIPF